MWSTRALVAMLSVATGCALDVSYSESRYLCSAPSEACPLGYRCSDRGYCEEGSAPFLDASADSGDDVGDPEDGGDEGDGGDGDLDAAPVLDGGKPDAGKPDAGKPDAGKPDAAVVFDASPPDAGKPDASPGPTTVSLVASRDTRLHGGERTFNFGATAELVCNGNPDIPVLLGWSLAALPGNAIVDSATLRLSTTGNALQGESAQVFALLEDWNEGNQNGSAGVANYDQRKAGTNWATAGAKPPSRSNSPFLTFAPTTPNTTYDLPLPKSLVQSWVSAPAANFGIVITCPFSNDVGFHSRSVSGKQPILLVTYHL